MFAVIIFELRKPLMGWKALSANLSKREGLLTATRLKRNRDNFKGKMNIIGIDLHKHSRRMIAVLQEGIVRKGTIL